MTPAYITRLSKFLPNDPVLNDEMEKVLGMVGNKPSKARNIVLRNNGIKKRYYAIKDGIRTHSNAELAAIAVRLLFNEKLPISALQVLTAGTTSPEHILPSHASSVHGQLNLNHSIEIISPSGACCSSMQGLKYAYMAIRSQEAEVAASVGSERFSSWLTADKFNNEVENLAQLEANPYLAFEKEFLRWMLSDGASAALLQPKPNDDGLSFRIEWLETRSFANELETCMYAGAIKNDDTSLTGWNDMPVHEWSLNSVFSYKQDTRLLGANIIPQGGIYLKELMQKHGLTPDMVDYYLPHMSSEFFKSQIYEHHKQIGMDIPYEKWFYNLPQVGNVGSASPFLMLEEILYSGRLKPGDRLLVMVPESARFSYAYMYLTVV